VDRLDTLFGLAEVAIGMAGFSAIVVIFKRLDSGQWRRDDADRFNGMLIHSMAAAFFCVLPPFLAAFLAEPVTLWRVGSGLLGLQIAVHASLIARLSSTAGIARGVVLAGALVALDFQVLNVTGADAARGFAWYLIGVLWHLLHAGALFVMLVWVRASDVQGDPAG